MIRKQSLTSLILPFCFTLVCLFVLISLGNWQMARKVEKAELIAITKERVKGAPISFRELKRRARANIDFRYQPVEVTGRFDHSEERHYFLPYKDQVGWRIITPLTTNEGDVVFIDRGFVVDAFKPREKRSDGLVAGVVTIRGLARRGEERRFFSPENQVAENRWFWRDLDGLYRSLKKSPPQQLSFMIDAGADAKVGDWPLPGVTRLQFRDPHFSYAMTWYGIGAALIFVFVAFAVHRLREKG